ncbi:MAG: substrate-binding domain-containing protein [Opitutaceae bacterium]
MPSRPSEPKPSRRLDLFLRARAIDDAWPVDRPLPTTRELAKRFKLSAATAFRTLQELARENLFWQHTSGRFYRAVARPLLDRPKPVACLIRRLELCSALYRELLEGVSAGAGEARRAMLLWHDDVLVNHADPARSPRFAGMDSQRLLLDDFLGRHGDAAGGYLLDHVWSDAVLKRAGRRLAPGVLLFRKAPSGLPLSNAHADFGNAATQAISHLLGRGFTRIVPVEPFPGDPAVEEFFSAVEHAATALACRERLAPRSRAHTPEEGAALLQSLPRDARTALLVPEDHTATRLHAQIRQNGRPCPAQIGILAVMGTSVSAADGLSRLTFDFRAMGRTAVALLAEPRPRNVAFTATFHQGETT